tara:strand:+ start:14791 stop:15537 length:747 start_codon:yes stop_codon:yes gene_type:complete
MNTVEFSNEFDILYDNVATKGAPGIDLYEKSVYLTTAQLELVKNYYDPKSNRKQVGFERSEKRRVDLKELIRDYKSNIIIDSTDNISPDSQFFRIPSDTFLIIQEQATLGSEDECLNSKVLRVDPQTYDEYNIQKDNPFRQPDVNFIWRLDYYSQLGTTKNVELISPYPIAQYHIRYIKYPEPIILTALDAGEFVGMDLSIDGISTEQTCQLNTEIHREILNRAVELALRDYKENTLQNKIQTNNRNE